MVGDIPAIVYGPGVVSLRPTQSPSNKLTIERSIEDNDEKNEEDDSAISNQEEGVVETSEERV